MYDGPTADVFGGGPSPSWFSVFAFDSEGNLHDTGKPVGTWYSLHRILLFKSGTQAVVMFYKTAVGDAVMQGQVYALEVRDNKIYRTQNVVVGGGKSRAMGFSSYKDWDQVLYSDQYLKEFAPLTTAIPYPTLTVPRADS